ncbi:hypothetical protein ScPMuIL_017420 [Solemya velum]
MYSRKRADINFGDDGLRLKNNFVMEQETVSTSQEVSKQEVKEQTEQEVEEQRKQVAMAQKGGRQEVNEQRVRVREHLTSNEDVHKFDFLNLNEVPSSISVTVDFKADVLTIDDMRIPFSRFRYSFSFDFEREKGSSKTSICFSFSPCKSVEFMLLREMEYGSATRCQEVMDRVMLTKYGSPATSTRGSPAISTPQESFPKIISAARPTFYGILNVSIAYFNGANFEISKRFCIMDRECFCVCGISTNAQHHVLHFWENSGPNVLDVVQYDKAEGDVYLQGEASRYTVYKAVDAIGFMQAVEGIHSVSEGCYLDRKFLLKLGEQQRLLDTQEPSGTASILRTDERSSEQSRPGTSTSVECSPLAVRDDFEVGGTGELLEMIGEMEEATVQLSGNEAFQPFWDSACFEMLQLESEHLVPPVDMTSGGMDENNPDHFKRCLDTMKIDLQEQKYERALGHMQGCRRVFQTSTISCIINLLRHSDVDVLKHIFFYSYYS